MWGSDNGPDIYEEVKNALFKGIEDIKDPETIVTIIPFQATHTYEALGSWTFKAGDVDKFNEAKKVINSYTLKSVPGGYTDIYSALEKAKEKIDNSRVNYIFLLTDGKQSTVPSSPNKINKVDFSESELLSSLNNWCDYSNKKDVHLFYVMLTEVAASEQIIEIVKNECNAYAVKGTNINIAFIKPSSNEIKINLNDNPERIEIALTANDWTYIGNNLTIDLNLEENSLFELKSKSATIKNNKILIELKRKNDDSFEELIKNNPDGESKMIMKLSTIQDVKILNPKIIISVRNKKERVLTLEFTDDE
ncbi:vWA domain-containing protein [Brumimicrobium glaciale]|nr:hypothetical protein [Brumimicrobium glaciale]